MYINMFMIYLKMFKYPVRNNYVSVLTLLFTLTVNYSDMSLYTIPRYCYYRWCFRTGSVKVVPNSWSLIWPGTSSLSLENTPQSHRITSDCRFYLMSVPFLFLCITNSFNWYSKKVITCIFIYIFGITTTVEPLLHTVHFECYSVY